MRVIPVWQRVLAGFQLVGGTVCVVGSILVTDIGPETAHLRLFFFPVLAGALAAFAGFLLVVREEMGLWLSIAIQSAQVVAFNVGPTFVYLTGVTFMWVVSSVGTSFHFGLGGLGVATTSPATGTLQALGVGAEGNLGWTFLPGTSPVWSVGVNFVALFFATMLWRALDRPQAPADPSSPLTP